MARIVIVEDEIQVLMLAESVLQQAGHDTVSASTVAEAQALINSKHDKFDLVFADVELGGGVRRSSDRTSYQSGQVFTPPFGKGCFQFDAEPRGGGFGK